MSLTSISNLVSKTRSSKSKDSISSKKSRLSVNSSSVHGSKFGRSISKFPKQNEPSLIQTISTTNSRVVRTNFNFPIGLNSKLPDLTQIESTDCIRELGSFLNILDYEFNYGSFWLLDILSMLIRKMQNSGFSLIHQNKCLIWFKFILRSISITGADREEMFNLLQQMFQSATKIIEEGKTIPLPEEIKLEESSSTILSEKLSKELNSFISTKSSRLQSKDSSSSKKRKSSSRKSLKSPSTPSRRSMKTTSSTKSLKSSLGPEDIEDIKNINQQIFFRIIELVYEVFADRFMFTMVSKAFSSPTFVTPVDIHIDFKDLKQLKPEVEPPAPIKVESSKTRARSPSKSRKSSKSNKKKGKSSQSEGKIRDDSKEVDEKKSKRSKKEKGKIGKGKNNSKSMSLEKERTTEEVTEIPNKSEKVKSKDKKPKDSKEATSPENEKAEKSKKSNLKKGKSKDKKLKDSKPKEVASPEVEKIEKNKKTSLKKGKSKEKATKSSKTKGKSKKERISKPSILKEDSAEQALQDKIKQFERTVSPRMIQETEKIQTKDQYILPLSQAVDKNYVEKIFKAMMPPKIVSIEEPSLSKEYLKEK